MKKLLRWLSRLFDIPLEWLCRWMLKVWKHLLLKGGLKAEAKELDEVFEQTAKRLKER